MAIVSQLLELEHPYMPDLWLLTVAWCLCLHNSMCSIKHHVAEQSSVADHICS